MKKRSTAREVIGWKVRPRAWLSLEGKRKPVDASKTLEDASKNVPDSKSGSGQPKQGKSKGRK
jgi:hypothetical protein